MREVVSDISITQITSVNKESNALNKNEVVAKQDV
jgi:hypothetical protein